MFVGYPEMRDASEASAGIVEERNDERKVVSYNTVCCVAVASALQSSFAPRPISPILHHLKTQLVESFLARAANASDDANRALDANLRSPDFPGGHPVLE